MLFPSATYDATATHALNHSMTNRQSIVAKAYTLPNLRALGYRGTATKYINAGMDNQH